MDVNTWYKNYKNITNVDRYLVQEEIKKFTYTPKISLIMPVYNTKKEWFIKSIESIQQQLYTNWELCICDNGSTQPHVQEVLKEYSAKDPRIRFVKKDVNEGISVGTNLAVDLATGDFCGMFDSDDCLAEVALYLVVDALNKNRDLNYIYTDQVHIDENENFSGAYFKPEFSPHLICSQNYITHFSVYRAELIKKLKLRSKCDGSQDYDLTLRVIDSVPYNTIHHIPYLAYIFRRHSGSEGTARESFAIMAAMRALEDHVERLGRKAEVLLHWPWYRVKYKLDNPPNVDVVIVSRNKDGLLYNCINNFIAKTYYPNYTFYICTPTKEQKAIAAKYGALVEKGMMKFVERDESEEYSYSKFANRTVAACQGPIICLLNDDIEPIEENWLMEMTSYAVQPEIGVVGAKLLYPNMTTQHAGVVLGICSDVSNHTFKGKPFNYDGYYGKNRLIADWSVVTGACSVMRKEVYEQVGGYEEALKVAYNDVDFCLKLLKAGYYNILNPYALLVHYEALTRGPDQTAAQWARFAEETKFMKDKWGSLLKNDPFYHPDLSLDGINFEIAEKSRYKKPWLK